METLTTPPRKKPSLFGRHGKGAMGFLEEVKAYALKQLAQYEEQDILCSTCEERDGQVVLLTFASINGTPHKSSRAC
jgi:hypothetical protein